jgi:hypothetical protein
MGQNHGQVFRDEEMEQLRNERDQRRHADEDRCAARRVAELEKLKSEAFEVTRRSRRNSRDYSNRDLGAD